MILFQDSKEQHLFVIEIFCNFINVVTVTFDWLNFLYLKSLTDLILLNGGCVYVFCIYIYIYIYIVIWFVFAIFQNACWISLNCSSVKFQFLSFHFDIQLSLSYGVEKKRKEAAILDRCRCKMLVLWGKSVCRQERGTLGRGKHFIALSGSLTLCPCFIPFCPFKEI